MARAPQATCGARASTACEWAASWLQGWGGQLGLRCQPAGATQHLVGGRARLHPCPPIHSPHGPQPRQQGRPLRARGGGPHRRQALRPLPGRAQHPGLHPAVRPRHLAAHWAWQAPLKGTGGEGREERVKGAGDACRRTGPPERWPVLRPAVLGWPSSGWLQAVRPDQTSGGGGTGGSGGTGRRQVGGERQCPRAGGGQPCVLATH